MPSLGCFPSVNIKPCSTRSSHLSDIVVDAADLGHGRLHGRLALHVSTIPLTRLMADGGAHAARQIVVVSPLGHETVVDAELVERVLRRLYLLT